MSYNWIYKVITDSGYKLKIWNNNNVTGKKDAIHVLRIELGKRDKEILLLRKKLTNNLSESVNSKNMVSESVNSKNMVSESVNFNSDVDTYKKTCEDQSLR